MVEGMSNWKIAGDRGGGQGAGGLPPSSAVWLCSALLSLPRRAISYYLVIAGHPVRSLSCLVYHRRGGVAENEQCAALPEQRQQCASTTTAAVGAALTQVRSKEAHFALLDGDPLVLEVGAHELLLGTKHAAGHSTLQLCPTFPPKPAQPRSLLSFQLFALARPPSFFTS